MSTPPGPGAVVLPAHEGRRSSTTLGRAIIADALETVDAQAAASARAERDWRHGYAGHFARIVEATAHDSKRALNAARSGLRSLQQRMCLFGADGEESLATAFSDAVDAAEMPDAEVSTVTRAGSGSPAGRLEIPYRGRTLHGTHLRAQLDRWVEAGVLEPPFADALRQVIAHPEALTFGGRPVVLIGAAAALGPLAALSQWGAHVVAVDVAVPAVQERIAREADAGAGRCDLPQLASRAVTGLELHRHPAVLAAWLHGLLADQPAPIVVASFYADGPTHVELTAAHVALVEHLRARQPETALAYLATPTDAFLTSEDAVGQARARWDQRAWNGRAHAAARTLSRRRLFRPAYQALVEDDHGSRWGVIDTIVTAQGPNYALAKRAQRWHAMCAAADGALVSANVAPSSWTASVTRNKALAAAFRAADRFGIEVFEPETSSHLMAAKLAADVAGLSPRGPAHPEALLSHDAAHGGLWRQPFHPASALGVAGLLGILVRPAHQEH